MAPPTRRRGGVAARQTKGSGGGWDTAAGPGHRERSAATMRCVRSFRVYFFFLLLAVLAGCGGVAAAAAAEGRACVAGELGDRANAESHSLDSLGTILDQKKVKLPISDSTAKSGPEVADIVEEEARCLVPAGGPCATSTTTASATV